MLKLAVYGKGGGGKSTIVNGLSVSFAKLGLKVLHIGCDPKTDSSFCLTGGRPLTTMLDLLAQGKAVPEPELYLVKGRYGIDCVEAGGPEPGSGCAGRGIARMFELFNHQQLLKTHKYDVVVFDVLGDVVCGGFAAPMRLGFADKVLLVVSAEPMSLFAANNICRAIVTYSPNGIRLAGLVANNISNDSELDRVKRFADKLGSTILAVVPHDKSIVEAESRLLTAAEASNPQIGETFLKLARLLLAESINGTVPTPLSHEEVFGFGKNLHKVISMATKDGDASSKLPILSSNSPGPTMGPVSSTEPVIAGAKGKKLFTELTGIGELSKKQLDVKIVRVSWHYNRFQIVLKGALLGRFTVEISKKGEVAKPYKLVGDLCLSYIGKRKLTPLQKWILGYLEKKLATVAYSELVHALANDPGAKRQKKYRTPRKNKVRIYGQVDSQEVEFKFFFPEETKLHAWREVELVDASVKIHHAIAVCGASEQPDSHGSFFLIRPPFSHSRTESQQSHRHTGLDLSTNMADYDIVAGGNKRLVQILESAKEFAKGGTVWVDVTCVPVIAGEDWQACIRQARDKFGLDIYATDTQEGTEVQAVTVALKKRFCDILQNVSATARVARTKPMINLVGYRKLTGILEVIELLDKVGVVVNQFQVPKVYVSELQRYFEAGLQVLWPDKVFESVYEEVFYKLPLPWLKIAPPYGFEGTTQFVMRLASHFDLQTRAQAVLESLKKRLVRQFEHLKRRCSRHVMGFVLAPSQRKLLEKSENVFGIDMQKLLQEMGFHVEVLKLTRQDKRLSWWLDSRVSAVYSDLNFDTRLLRAGVGQFSVQDFEPGFYGTIRTMKRLLARCENRFVKQYASRYLS